MDVEEFEKGLLQCPFCGKSSFSRGTSWTSEGTFDYVECKCCKCRGPLVESAECTYKNRDVSDLWNRRYV